MYAELQDEDEIGVSVTKDWKMAVLGGTGTLAGVSTIVGNGVELAGDRIFA